MTTERCTKHTLTLSSQQSYKPLNINFRDSTKDSPQEGALQSRLSRNTNPCIYSSENQLKHYKNIIFHSTNKYLPWTKTKVIVYLHLLG